MSPTGTVPVWASKTHGSAVEEVGGVPHPTVVDHRPSAARPPGETGRPAAPERRRVISVSPVRLLSWMDRSHRIGRMTRGQSPPPVMSLANDDT